GVPRNLETICLKCLQKAPGRRYASALALADDLRRFLEHRPIEARPAGPVERAAKWGKRRPAVAGLLLAVVLVALAGSGLVTWQWQEADQARLAERARKLEVEERERDARASAEAERRAAQAERRALRRAGVELYLGNIARAHRDWLAGNASRAAELLD